MQRSIWHSAEDRKRKHVLSQQRRRIGIGSGRIGRDDFAFFHGVALARRKK